jgi:hypothetical protein
MNARNIGIFENMLYGNLNYYSSDNLKKARLSSVNKLD